jgi:hypothetical protein
MRESSVAPEGTHEPERAPSHALALCRAKNRHGIEQSAAGPEGLVNDVDGEEQADRPSGDRGVRQD